ncbi:Aminomethyltransferase folate-binding domain-containing protein [Sporormia fimetaria CBS 119925]|uniref:Iron-sulfur cluster assembly factor IBA57 homolog, mitochondrial n=1 Tax=Sporormia fimetaria CBS 119925 TaxID=1340428 RepID=A0A6A6UZ27_9PLEO|nr:Aminomethyltransferase folate-binding domain-containing protein [Sporormia fimetaria CBS 119925]
MIDFCHSGIVCLTHRRLVKLSGPDTAKFLQGLITNNVESTSSEPFYSAFLDARGRVLWDVFVWPMFSEEQWGCLLEIDGEERGALVKHLRRHKLRSKITIEVLGEEDADGLSVWAGWGSNVITAFEAEQLIASMPDPRAGDSLENFATRFLFRGSSPSTDSGITVLELQQYTLRRYLFGVPEGPSEISRENALPMEYNIELAKGIDFRKGCYVGQELTIRTKHTGVVRKRVLPVQLYNSEDKAPSTKDDATGLPHFDAKWQPTTDLRSEALDIKQLDDLGSIKRGRAAGKLIARYGNVGLGLCRLEMMTPMRVSAEGGSFKPGVEFGVQTAEAEETRPVRVKAFLPDWLIRREKDVWAKTKPKRQAEEQLA